MEYLGRSKAIIELGQQLVTALGLGNDPVAQWMAHVIAEQMEAVQHAPKNERVLAQDACMQTIFSLWEHRNSMPRHARPFCELGPLLQTIESLQVGSGTRPRYFHRHPSSEELEGTTGLGKQLLDVAINLDYSARVLIHYLLSAGAQEAAEKAVPWLQAAVEAGADAGIELQLVEFVSGGGAAHESGENARQVALDKVERLEAFAQLATIVAADLRSKFSPSINDNENPGV